MKAADLLRITFEASRAITEVMPIGRQEPPVEGVLNDLGETLQHSKGDAITAACRIAVTATT